MNKTNTNIALKIKLFWEDVGDPEKGLILWSVVGFLPGVVDLFVMWDVCCWSSDEVVLPW